MSATLGKAVVLHRKEPGDRNRDARAGAAELDITCKSSHIGNDVRCNVCGQGFLVYWADKSPAERARQYTSVLEVLRKHHAAMETERVHPAGEFQLPAGGPNPGSMLRELPIETRAAA